MNPAAPPLWESVSYALVCIVALAMAVFTLAFVSSHCEWVYQETGIPGACGLGYGWAVIALAFLAIAVYAGRELLRSLAGRRAGEDRPGGDGSPPSRE